MDGSNKKTRIPFELPSEASVPSDIYTILLLVYCRNQQTNIDISLVRTVIAQLREPHSFFNNKAATALITSKAASPNNAVILPLGRPPAYWGGGTTDSLYVNVSAAVSAVTDMYSVSGMYMCW